MPDKGLVREIDILEKLYTKCYNESKASGIKGKIFRNGLYLKILVIHYALTSSLVTCYVEKNRNSNH